MITPFVTETGVPVATVSVDQMREVDRIAIEYDTPNLFQMMENAGRSLARLSVAHLGDDWLTTPISVLAGPGGNGGGGIVAARHLANWGGDVTLILAREPGAGTIQEQQLGIYDQTAGRASDTFGSEAGLLIDALIGYGLGAAPRGRIDELILAMSEIKVPVISLDVPSGLDADTGTAPGSVVRPDSTLTLALAKPGLEVEEAGDLWLADLGIPLGVFSRAGILPSPRIFSTGPLLRLLRRLS